MTVKWSLTAPWRYTHTHTHTHVRQYETVKSLCMSEHIAQKQHRLAFYSPPCYTKWMQSLGSVQTHTHTHTHTLTHTHWGSGTDIHIPVLLQLLGNILTPFLTNFSLSVPFCHLPNSPCSPDSASLRFSSVPLCSSLSRRPRMMTHRHCSPFLSLICS